MEADPSKNQHFVQAPENRIGLSQFECREDIASDHDESNVEELPEVDISVLSVQPYMFEQTKSSENGTVESESESEDENSNRFY